MIKKKNCLCFLVPFDSLNVTYHSQKNLLEEISKEFDRLYIINIDNLQFFSKEKNYEFSDEIKNKPDNIILFNPKNSTEFENFHKDKFLIAINNFGKTFFDFKIHLLLNRKNIVQIQCKNIGNFQMDENVSYKHISLTLNYLILNRFFRKLTTFFSSIGIVKKFEISFISDSNILRAIKSKNFKNFLYKKKLLFTKEFCLVNSRYFDELKKIKKISNSYIVHIDYYLNYNHETRLRGKFSDDRIKKHHDLVYKFLNILKKKLNKEVKICIHPLYPLDYFKKHYKDFEVIKYKTKDMISNADLVTFFDSSSIVDAILLDKKIFSLSSIYMGKNERIHSTVYSKKLDIINIELSNFKEEDFENLYQKSSKYNQKFQDFKKTYHQFDPTENGYSKIIKTIKSRFY
tara:strand:+ start:14 stop:1219 length:1206 start_codon:yes stop_codon:yes gene_type:complete